MAAPDVGKAEEGRQGQDDDGRAAFEFESEVGRGVHERAKFLQNNCGGDLVPRKSSSGHPGSLVAAKEVPDAAATADAYIVVGSSSDSVANDTPGNNGCGNGTLSNLIGRPPVMIEFEGITYPVYPRYSRLHTKLSCPGPLASWLGWHLAEPILKGISGRIVPGELTAIIGPSGAGKSTFMNILAGYETSNIEGTIRINGKPRNLSKFRKYSCYIMQSDVGLADNLTVREAVTAAARLKVEAPEDCKAGKVEVVAAVVREVLDTLGLSECADTRAAKLSGGQRKRLAIAQELVNNPPVMFFDEPTSGLDSAACLQCISVLKGLANEGRTIICTIHQPSARVFEMFDRVVLVSEGRVAFHGAVPDFHVKLRRMGKPCPPFHNLADHILDVLNENGSAVFDCDHHPSGGQGVQGPEGEEGLQQQQGLVAKGGPKAAGAAPGTTGSSSLLLMSSSSASRMSGKPHLSGEAAPLASSKVEEDSDCSEAAGDEEGPAAIRPHHHTHNHEVALDLAQEGPTVCGDVDDPAKSGVVSEAAPPQGAAAQKSGSQESLDDHYRSYATSAWTQFKILSVRSFKIILRDEVLTVLRLVSHLLVALILGWMFYGVGRKAGQVYYNAGLIFFCHLFLMFTAMMPTVMTFPSEMEMFRREHLNHWYRTSIYYVARTTADLPFQLALPMAYLVIVYFLTGQPLDLETFAKVTLSCTMTALVAQSTGLLIGCICRPATAVYLGPILTIPILLFSGFFLPVNKIPVPLRYLTYAAYVGYGFEASLISIYKEDTVLKCDEAFCLFKHPIKFLEQLGLDTENFAVDILFLFVTFVLFRIVGYFLLCLNLRRRRR